MKTLDRGTWMPALVLALTLASCGDGERSGDDDDDGGTRVLDFSGPPRDSADGDDDTADDDDATDDDDDEGSYIEYEYLGEDPYPYVLRASGLVGLDAVSFAQDGATGTGFSVMAQFFEVLTEEESQQMGEELEPFDGLDDCGLVHSLPEGLVDFGEWRFLDAGNVELSGSGESTTLAQVTGGEVLSYVADLGDLGLTPRFDSTYDLETSGDDFPAMRLISAVALPPELVVETPRFDGDGQLSPDGLTLRWTAGGGPIDVRLMASNGGEGYLIECLAEDDGELTIPGSLLGELPAGWDVWLELTRRRVRELDLGFGKVLLSHGGSRYFTSTTVAAQ